jgi:Tol biopolymer transport system component
LEKDRDLRYQSAAEFRADLKRLRRDTSSGQTLGLAGARWPAGREGATARAFSALRRRWWIAAMGAIVAAALLAYLGLRPLPPPRVTAYRQITSDGFSKDIAGTDGARLYFTEDLGVGSWIAQMATSGGEPARVPTPSPAFRLLDVSPDGSSLLTGEITTYGQGSLWTLPILGGSPHRVGNLVASQAAWSPDGQRIAYAQEGDLFVAQNDGSGARKLASVRGLIRMPAWSPNARRICFTAYDAPRLSMALWEVSAEGTNAHPLFPGWHNPPQECCGRWTPDGKYFLFASQGAIWALAEPRGLLHRAAPPPAQLTSGPVSFNEALPSKDGKYLFAVGMAPRGELVRYDDRSKQFVPVLSGVSAEFVSFSKDGQWVAYVTYPDGALWRSKADGTDRLQLVQSSFFLSVFSSLAPGGAPPSYALSPRWSPDGTEIAYYSQAPGRLARMYRVSPSGGQPQELLSSLSQARMDPNWSPDGKKVCFGGASGIAPLPTPNIHILDLETQTVTDVPGSNGFFSPRWSPDGRYLTALSLDSARLALFDFSSQKWEEIVARAFFSFPCWSHNGRYLYYLQGVNNPAIVRFGIANRKAERVVDLKDFPTAGFYGSSLSLTPDDQPIMTRNIGTQEIFALDWQAP